MQHLKVQGYDVILQSTTHCSKYVDSDSNSGVITYCHSPFRLVFRPNFYKQVAESGYLKRKLYDAVIGILKRIDKRSAHNRDWFVTNVREVVLRIVSAYHPKNPIVVINPPVKCKKFYVSAVVEDYYFVVSRFEPYKRVDPVIEAIKQLHQKKLLVVGKGSMESELKKNASSNVTFLHGLNSNELAKAFSYCKALIFPQLHSPGSYASGRPSTIRQG